jgi:creatinine amidohydrolase
MSYQTSKVWLQNNRWQEVKEKLEESKGVILIPWGSLEQHSLHLPEGTDSYVAITIAEDAAQQTGVLCAPCVFPGWSPQHMMLPGTITIRPEILIEFCYDMLSSLAHHGFKRFVLINGHRLANLSWMAIAAERAQRADKCVVKLFDPSYMSKDIVGELGWGANGHSEEHETSHMLARYPELVCMELANDNPVQPPSPGGLYSVDPRYPHDTLNLVPNTVEWMSKYNVPGGGGNGMPTLADGDKGQIYHDHIVKNLVTVIRYLQRDDAE